MNRFVVSMILVLLVQAPVHAKTPVRRDGLVYYMPTSYNDSVQKKDSTVEGAYIYYGLGDKRSYEAEVDLTSITYKSGFVYHEKAYTLVSTNYSQGGKTFVGAHYIAASNNVNDALTLFAGKSRVNADSSSLQISGYVTQYGKFTPKLKAYQLTPAVGRYYKNDYRTGVHFQTKAYIIHTTKKIVTNTRDFLSVEETVSWTHGGATVSATGWMGEQAFAVHGDGYAVYNLEELHRGGYGVSVSHALGSDTRVTLSFSRELFKDAGTDNKASSDRLGLSVGRTL